MTSRAFQEAAARAAMKRMGSRKSVSREWRQRHARIIEGNMVVERCKYCRKEVEQPCVNGAGASQCENGTYGVRYVDTQAVTPLKWAVQTFGPIATNRDERAARMLEEAVEFAQAEGVSKEVAERILSHAYGRPPGNSVDELRGVCLTLASVAENIGQDVMDLTAQELDRVRKRSQSDWKKRHDIKVADGRANLTP